MLTNATLRNCVLTTVNYQNATRSFPITATTRCEVIVKVLKGSCLYTCRHHDGVVSEGTQPSEINKAEVALCVYRSLQIFTWTSGQRKYAFWLNWIEVLIMARSYDTTFTRARRLTAKTKKNDKLDWKPVLCQRTFSSVFRVVFYTVKLHSLTVSVWAPSSLLS
jgi:hypothetical protein